MHQIMCDNMTQLKLLSNKFNYSSTGL